MKNTYTIGMLIGYALECAIVNVCKIIGKVLGGKMPKGIEITCHSRKEINIVDKCKQLKEPREEYKENYKEMLNK